MNNEFAPRTKGPRRKDPAHRMRHTIHVCLNDELYLGLLKKSTGQDVSAYVRGLIQANLAVADPTPDCSCINGCKSPDCDKF